LAIVLKKNLDRYPQGDTLKDNKRGVIEEIHSYDEKSGQYQVKYEGGKYHRNTREVNLREGAPTELSLEKKRYWIQKCPNFPKGVPERILKMVPKIQQKPSDKPPPLLTFD
jgi:hypothetical protein